MLTNVLLPRLEFSNPFSASFFNQSEPLILPFSTNHIAALISFLGLLCHILMTSFWPCLRHGSLASSLPLPTAQAIACWGRCPQTPIYYSSFIYYLILSSIFTYHLFS